MGSKAACLLPLSFLSAEVLCFWPVWKWYAERMLDGSDEPWGVAALLTGLAFVARNRTRRPIPVSLAASLPLLIYVLFYSALPSLARAGLAMLSITLTISPLLLGTTLHLGFAALTLLSLPIIASLQFYLGFPLRVVNGEIAAFLLRSCGEFVTAHGTTLLWRGDYVVIDAPCSGIKMLWGGLYFCFTLASFAHLSNRKTWLAYTFAAFSVFLANILRTFVLFFSETRILPMPTWFHSGVGLLCFFMNAVLVLAFIRWIRVYGENPRLV